MYGSGEYRAREARVVKEGLRGPGDEGRGSRVINCKEGKSN